MNVKKSLLCLGVIGLITLTHTSCGKATFVDYAHNGSLQLSLDYKGKDFFKDGIAQVEVAYYIDGDTTHFRMKGSTNTTLIKSRYYGIDTPESTGKIEEYGEEAKRFTHEKLLNAMENGTIVVSSPFFEYKAPEFDSTGTRYLSLVWINENVKNADYTSLSLLNLYIVQEGLSYVKALDKVPTYQDTFINAENQAKTFKLNLHSGKPAELFNYGDYQATSLLDIKRELEKTLKDSSYKNPYNNAKVRVRGTVAGYANSILYLQAYFTEEESGTVGGEYAGINVYTGMSSIPSKYTDENSYIEISGTLSNSENFGFQMSGVTFQRTAFKDEDEGSDKSKVIYTPETIPDEYKVHTFEAASTDIKEQDFAKLFSPVKVTNTLTCTGGYVSDSSGDITLYLSPDGTTRSSWNLYVPFVYYPYESSGDEVTTWSTIDSFKGKKFNVTGIYTFRTYNSKTTYQIVARNSSDLVLVTE